MSAATGAATLPTPAEIDAAWARMAPHVRVTPLVHAPTLSERTGLEVWLKHEHAQHTGSFKIRGALNALLGDPREAGPVGAASAGNHAFALAEAARASGRHAVLFVPESAPRAKVAGIRDAGGDVRLVAGSYDDAEDAALDWLDATPGARLVHAFDDPAVVCGQGTLALEMMRQHAGLRTIVAPVGGGGLLAGLAAAIGPAGGTVIGVQGDRTRAVFDALRENASADGAHDAPVVPTVMDGLAGRTTAGAVARLRLAEARVELVPEDAVRAAMRFLFEEGLRVEGSGAVGVAALLAGVISPTGPVGVILSGGNVDEETLEDVLERST